MTIKLDRKQTEALADTLHLAGFSGGSGRGMHFWSDAAKCGMRAQLGERRRKEMLGDHAEIPATPGPEATGKNAFAVGSAYHKLHELVRTAGAGYEEIDREGIEYEPNIFGASAEEAMRLFNGWVRHWPVDLWGQTIAVEEVISDRAYFDTEVTAMPDMVVDVRDEHLERVRQRCPELPGPGTYIIDFKTSDQPYHELYYKGGMQALWYPLAWNAANPKQPARGIIFDTVYKFGRRKDQSITPDNFGAVYAESPEPQAWHTLSGLIRQGQANLALADEGYGNRAECMGFSFSGVKVCQFYGHGCPNEAL